MSKLIKNIFNENSNIEMPSVSTFSIEDCMIKIEIPIGSTFFVDSYKIIVVEENDEVCKDCIFYNLNCINLKCYKEVRKDNKDVKFILLEK